MHHAVSSQTDGGQNELNREDQRHVILYRDKVQKRSGVINPRWNAKCATVAMLLAFPNLILP